MVRRKSKTPKKIVAGIKGDFSKINGLTDHAATTKIRQDFIIKVMSAARTLQKLRGIMKKEVVDAEQRQRILKQCQFGMARLLDSDKYVNIGIQRILLPITDGKLQK